MPVIEGYNFTVDMQDRGMVKTLRTIKSEAQALKNVMRANFTELRNSEGSLAAYSTRLENAQTSIQKYDEAIKKLRETNQALEQSVKDGTKNRDVADAAIARNINTIERYKIRMTSLSHQMKQDMMIFQRLGTGIDTLRKSTEAITTSTKSYTDALREQNKYYRSDRAHIEGLRSTRESLKAQLRSEISVTDSLRIHQKELTEEYQREKISLNQNRVALAKRAKELAENKRLYGVNSAAVDVTRSKMSDLNETIEKQESHLAGLSERLGKNSTTLANQAQEASKVASSYRQVDRASRGIRTTRIASAFRAGSQHIQHFSNALKESTANTRKWWSESRGAFAGVGVALGGLAAGAGKAIQSATEVQRRYIEVRNLLETSGEHTSEAIRHMNAMQREGVKTSQEYGFAQKDIAEQYEELVKRGYSGTAALGSMNAMLKASRASGDDLADTVRVTSEAVDSFGLRVTKGANATKRMEYNTERVANAIASASDRTSSSFQTTGIALGYVSGSAKTLGWSVEETAAAIGKMSDAGVSGTRAGTGLRQVINSLIRPTKAAKVAFKQAGLSIDDFHTKSGKMKSVDKIFGEINEKTKSMSQTERGAFFKAVFGATGQQAAQILARSAKGMKNNRSELTKLIEEIRHDEKTDYIGRLSRKNMQSAKMQIERLKQTGEAFEVTIGAALLPAVNKVGVAIGKWAVSKEGQQSFKDANRWANDLGRTVTKSLPNVIAFGKGLGDGIKGAATMMKPLVSGIKFVGNALDKINGHSHTLSRWLGATVGFVGSIALAFKGIKVVGGGILAITKDTMTFGSKIKTLIHGQSGEQENLNDVLKQTNQILKENVDLQKELYRQQQKSNDLTSDDLSDIPGGGDTHGNRTTLHGTERREIQKEADDTYSTFRRRLKARIHGDKNISWGEVFHGVKGSARNAGRVSGTTFWGRLKSRIGEMSAEDRFNVMLDVGFSVAQLTSALGDVVHARTAHQRYEGYGEVIGTGLGGGIGFLLGGTQGMLIGEALGGQLVKYAVPKFIDGFKKATKKLKLDAPSEQEGNGYIPQTPKHTHSYSWDWKRGFWDNLGYNYDVNVHNRAAEIGHLFDTRWWNKESQRKGNSPLFSIYRSMADSFPQVRAARVLNAGWNFLNSKQAKPFMDWMNSDSIAKALFGSPKVNMHGHKFSTKDLQLKASSILPKVDVGKWWKGITKDFKKLKWPKMPKIRMPKLNIGKWWNGVKKWWHGLKWPKFPEIHMPKLNAKKWAGDAVKDIKSGWRGFTGWTSKLGRDSNKNLKNGWKGMQSWASGVHGNVKKGWHGFEAWNSRMSKSANRYFKSHWREMTKFSSGVASNFKSGWHGMTHWFGSLGHSMVSSFKDKFSGLRDWVSDRVQDIQDAWDDAGKHVRNFLTKGHFANGTGPIQTPTLGILNDGNDAPEINNSEGLLHKDGVLEMLAGRNVKRLLLPGDQVIKASEMSKLLGVRHFAGGAKSSKTSLVSVSVASLNKFYSVVKSMLEIIRTISKNITNLVKKADGGDKLHDASYSHSYGTYTKKSSGKKTKDMTTFGRLGFYGRLKSTIHKIMRSRSGERIYLSQQTRRELGYKNAKGSANVNATKSLLNRISRFYEKRKRENAKIIAEQRKQREQAKKREERKQANLKREMDLTDAKYNLARKKAVLRKERVAERRKERREREAERKRRRRTSGLSERRTTSGGYTYTYTSTARRRRSGSTSRKRTRASVSVSVRGASAITRLLKKISGTHKFRVYVTQKGAKKVQSIIESILKQINSSRSKRSMLVRISQSGYKKVSGYLSSILKKVNSKKTDRSMLIHISQTGYKNVSGKLSSILKQVNSKLKARSIKIHISQTGYKNVSGKLSAIIDKVKDLQKGKKNELTVHVKHDGVRETKKALESVASTDKKMWKDIESYSSSGIRKMTSQFNSFSRSYRSGFSNMARAIRSTMSHAWSEMHSDAHRGLDRVIGVLREAVGRINGVVKSFGGKNAVSKPAYLATGTGALGTSQRRAITRPTLAVLNDGHDSPETQNKEVVWTPWNNRFDVVPGQNTKALLMPGQEVLNATESKQLGFTHFATGTGALKHLYELAKKYWHSPIKTGESMFGTVTGLTGAINSLAQGMRHSTEGQGVDWWSQLWKMVQNKVEDGLGPASGLLKAVEELGKNKHYSQGKRMSKFFADCSSLVSRALAKYYHVRWSVPNGWALTVAGLWQHAHRISRSEAKPGDPVFWLPDTHVGVYAGHGKYYSAYGPNDGGPVGMQSVGPGATFGRFDGLNTEGDKSKDVKVKANNALQKKIRGQVGKGFWKTIQKITDKFGDNGMAAAFRLGGDIGQRAKAIARALKQAVPGATRAGLSAVIGSWEFESGGLNPAAVNPNGGASGLGQWLYDRKTALLAYARRHGKSWKDPATQINFAVNADSTNSAILKRILRSSGTPSGLATEFSREWERGGYDAQHASAARDIYRVLHGFANGGIATKASIFGEAGPEMAIPLSTDKLDRSRELVAQALAVMSSNSTNQSNLHNQQIQENSTLDQLVESVNKLTDLVSQILIKPETIQTTVSMDSQVIAKKVERRLRKSQVNRAYNTRMNRSNF